MRNIYSKVNRANRHIEELHRSIRRFIDTSPYKIRRKLDPRTGEAVYYLAEAPAVPDEMALIAGDVLQNLRSTLDHLAWALVETNGGKPTRVIAETASATRQAEAQRDLEIKKAEYAEQSRRQQASADKAYELQTNVMLQQVTAEQVKVQQVEKEGQIKVQEAEILRHEKELIATVLKGAKIERQRIENMAAAEKNR
jgi:hypothetical protein